MAERGAIPRVSKARQRALRTVLKDGVEPLLKQHDAVACGAHLRDCLTGYREVYDSDAGRRWHSFRIPAANKKSSR